MKIDKKPWPKGGIALPLNKPNLYAIATEDTPMSPTEAANAVKAGLLDVIEKMNDANKMGVKIEFNVGTDQATGQSQLAHFAAWQKMKIDQ